jgi:hypothetical protein
MCWHSVARKSFSVTLLCSPSHCLHLHAQSLLPLSTYIAAILVSPLSLAMFPVTRALLRLQRRVYLAWRRPSSSCLLRGAIGVVLSLRLIKSQFHTRWIQVFIRSTLRCITRAQAPCEEGDVKIYKGSRFRKTKYRGVWFGRGCAQVTSCYDESVAQDNGYVLHSVPRHHFPPRHEEQKVGGPRSA